MSNKCDVFRVTAETLNVSFYPLQRDTLVTKTIVGGKPSVAQFLGY